MSTKIIEERINKQPKEVAEFAKNMGCNVSEVSEDRFIIEDLETEGLVSLERDKDNPLSWSFINYGQIVEGKPNPNIHAKI